MRKPDMKEEVKTDETWKDKRHGFCLILRRQARVHEYVANYAYIVRALVNGQVAAAKTSG